jgi:transposase
LNGIPLVVMLTAANVHDSMMLEPLLDHIPALRNKHGRPTQRPKKLHADKGYDFPRCRKACAQRRISHRIARRGIESSSHLGKYRWVVERTLAWLHRFRRLLVRYERRADIHRAFLVLAAALIAFRFC